MSKKQAKLKIEVTRNVSIKGTSVKAGSQLVVGTDIAEACARQLLKIGKALPVATATKRTAVKKPTEARAKK